MRKENGVSSIIALIILLALAVFTISVLQMTATRYRASAFSQDSEDALFVADAGLEYAINQKSLDGSWTGVEDAAFGNGRFTVNLTSLAGGTEIITSIGMVNAMTRTIVGRLETDSAAFGYAILGQTAVTLSNGSVCPNGASIGCNAGAPSLTSVNTCTHDVQGPITPNVAIPAVSMARYRSEATAGGNYYDQATLSITDGSYNNAGVIYCTGEISVDPNNSNIDLSNVTLVAEGNITVVGRNKQNYVKLLADTAANYPAAVTETGAIDMSFQFQGSDPGHQVRGVIYSKGGNVTLRGIQHTDACIISGASVTIERGGRPPSKPLDFTVTYSLQSPRYFSTLAWKELK